MVMLRSDKIDFKAMTVTRDKARHFFFLMMKGSVYQAYLTILNVYVPNNRTSKCMKQKLTTQKEETNV